MTCKARNRELLPVALMPAPRDADVRWTIVRLILGDSGYFIDFMGTKPTRSTIFCPAELTVKSTNSFATPLGAPFV
jgi:hypothetical protein